MTAKQKARFIKKTIRTLGLSHADFAKEMCVARPRVVEWVHERVEVRDPFILAAECLLRRARKWPLS